MGGNYGGKTDKPQRNTPHDECFFGGQKRQQGTDVMDSDDECSDEGDERMVRRMAARQWELVPFPIAIDSGACASVLPADWCSHVSSLKTPQSEAKAFSGQRIAK